jgi:hypothetical protein
MRLAAEVAGKWLASSPSALEARNRRSHPADRRVSRICEFNRTHPSTGKRDGKHPHRHHRREIERSNAGDHAQRLARGVAIDASSDVLSEFALQQLRNGRREFHDFHAPLDFTNGVRVDLAMLGNDDVCEFVDTLLENPEEAVEYPGSPQLRRRRPSRRSFCCRSDGIRDIRGVRDRELSRICCAEIKVHGAVRRLRMRLNR